MILYLVLFVVVVSVTYVCCRPPTHQKKTDEEGLLPIFSRSEVAQHSTSDSCWIVLDNKVYDVSDFLNDHPGGRGPILAHAGKDASATFHAQHDVSYIDNTLHHFQIGAVQKEELRHRSPPSFDGTNGVESL
eukprot:NODE_9693_length_630_cov_88.163708_g9426_i0.p1 GENE.NODE_9693_length_630_cov_88.163708_g9426_i0~~NODE_9693_length_630_cov_88.163708_g9426_i0.p1  ORF type:complete len:132 (+),score=12.46 NODE_9693_length_630_cov_88.163708_g9426_i0:108-503(+)